MGKSGASSLLHAALVGALVLGMTGCTSTAPTASTPKPSSDVGVTEPTADPGELEEEEWGQGDPIPDEELSPPTTDMVSMADPVQESFTVDVPVGWDSVAYSTGTYDNHREAVVSVSPDGNTVLFIGDPKLPQYWDPNHPNNQDQWLRDWVEQSDVAAFRTYMTAVEWSQKWVKRKFGDLDGFLLLDTVEDPASAQKIVDDVYAATGSTVQASVARTSFTYETESGIVSAQVGASTMNSGASWFADVQGLSTLGEVADYEPMLSAMARSKKTDPNWIARRDQVWAQQNAQSQAFTDSLIANHNANMAWIQNSAAAHQNRMQAIWAAGDASMQNYYNRMDAMDNNQRSFLNYISEENTVAGPSGQHFQVAAGQTNYYVNPSNGQYVAGDINFSESDLREMGLNPNDYELTQIIR